jgi:ferredoxin-NADP reductase
VMCGGTGPASRWLHDELSPGQEIELIGIGGDFVLDVLGAAGDPTGPAEEAEVGITSLAPKKKTKKLLLLSAGIGITPFTAMLRSVRAAEAKALSALELDITLLHTTRAVEGIPDKAELEALQHIGSGAPLADGLRGRGWHTYPVATNGTAYDAAADAAAGGTSKIRVEWTVTQPGDGWADRVGRVTEQMLREVAPDLGQQQQLHQQLQQEEEEEQGDGTAVYLCGPDSYMEEMFLLLVGMGVPAADIHSESFVA